MGPAGAGKSTIAAALSRMHGWPMIEGDDHHPPANRAKQAAGVPLDDNDRSVWIDSLVTVINERAEPRILLACSALTPYVQSRLSAEVKRDCHWVLLQAEKATLQARIEARKGHFMPASLVDDQLTSLTPPKGAVIIDAAQGVDAICEQATQALDNKADQECS